MGEIVWQPDRERVEGTRLWHFMQSLPGRPQTYWDLWEWSITERGAFWQAIWDECGVIASQPASRPIGAEGMPDTEWFPGARLNFAENLLRRTDDAAAIISTGEGRNVDVISWRRLNARVARARAGLLEEGIAAGDRVAALIPNCPEAIIGMLAAASIGALWSSCSPDFGPMGVVDRFGQIEPKILIVADGYRYAGKEFPLERTVRTALERIPTVERVVVVDLIGVGLDAGETPAMSWQDLEVGDGERAEFAQLPFDHPLYIMYSSGTTGPPKSIVHRAGGVLIKHLSEHLVCDVLPDDRLFWFTTCGWMMWNWLVSGLASDAAVVLYDGNPGHPDLTTIWRLAERVRITHLGSSPRFLAANANAGIVPRAVADLSSLRWVGSTGAPLNPDQFDWVYRNVHEDVVLSSITGGTDLVGVFAGAVSILPVRRGEISAPWLGMAMASFDADGTPCVGEQGELVCTQPFPTMPLEFWRDPGGERYHEAYFSQYEGVWAHGDWVEVTPSGGLIVTGRSDTTLNPGGVRIGTAEIYRAIEGMEEIEDSIVVGRAVGDDQEVVLFVKPAAGIGLDAPLVDRIKTRIRTETTPRHVPRRILAVGDVPYTISGKKVEKAVHRIIAGEPVLNRDALANPESLDQYAALRAELG
jgi:acetoacetyl-CoA synthetase